MAETIETYRGVVYPWEIDHIDHMNVQFYTAKFDQATWHFFARLGLTPSYFRTRNRGMAAIQQNTSYQRELHAGDIVTITSELLEIGERKICFRHRMTNAETGDDASCSEFTGVHMDRTARRGTPFPEDVRAAGQAMLDAAGARAEAQG